MLGQKVDSTVWIPGALGRSSQMLRNRFVPTESSRGFSYYQVDIFMNYWAFALVFLKTARNNVVPKWGNPVLLFIKALLSMALEQKQKHAKSLQIKRKRNVGVVCHEPNTFDKSWLLHWQEKVWKRACISFPNRRQIISNCMKEREIHSHAYKRWDNLRQNGTKPSKEQDNENRYDFWPCLIGHVKPPFVLKKLLNMEIQWELPNPWIKKHVYIFNNATAWKS